MSVAAGSARSRRTSSRRSRHARVRRRACRSVVGAGSASSSGSCLGGAQPRGRPGRRTRSAHSRRVPVRCLGWARRGRCDVRSISWARRRRRRPDRTTDLSVLRSRHGGCDRSAHPWRGRGRLLDRPDRRRRRRWTPIGRSGRRVGSAARWRRPDRSIGSPTSQPRPCRSSGWGVSRRRAGRGIGTASRSAGRSVRPVVDPSCA